MENGDSWRNRRIFAHSSISSLFRQQLCLNCSVSLPRSSSPVWIAVTSTFGQEWGERRRLPIYVDPSQAWSRKGKHDRWKKAFTASELSDYGGIFISKRPQPFTNFTVIWKITESWMWAMKCTCFSCIMFFFPLWMRNWTILSTDGSTTASHPPTIEPHDSSGFGGCNRVQLRALLCRKKCLG